MYKIITPVLTEPVSLTEVRQHLRLPEDNTEDDLLHSLISAARTFCEDFTRRAFAEQTLELLLDRFPASGVVDLPCPPLRSVSSIKYRNSEGVESVVSSGDYLVDADREPGQVMPKFGFTWPDFTPYPSMPIRIRFVAGYADLQVTLRQAMLLLIGHWYETREATGTATDETAFSVHALLSPYRLEAF